MLSSLKLLVIYEQVLLLQKNENESQGVLEGSGFLSLECASPASKSHNPPKTLFLAHFASCLFKPSRGIILALISALALL